MNDGNKLSLYSGPAIGSTVVLWLIFTLLLIENNDLESMQIRGVDII